ncbi:MAG: hypothetical protein ACOX5F_00995 [Anaerovoracaceae bacterium]
MQQRLPAHGRAEGTGKKLIQQAADAAAGKSPPPFELEVLWMCRQFGCLPEGGGYLDQDARLMGRAVMCEEVYQLVKKWRGMAVKDLTQLNEAEKQLFKWLRKAKVTI